MSQYYIAKTLEIDFESALQKIETDLKKYGFGILTTIDVKAKFKEKLGREFRRYHILGACNPGFAYEAIQAEDKIGVLLPCNVIVQEIEDCLVEVAAVSPMTAMSTVNNPGLADLAGKVETSLKSFIENL